MAPGEGRPSGILRLGRANSPSETPMPPGASQLREKGATLTHSTQKTGSR